MPNLPDPAILTANGAYDIPGLVPGRTHLLTLKGVFGGATVEMTAWNDALGTYTPVDGGSWDDVAEVRFAAPSSKARLTVTSAGGTTAIGVTLIGLPS